MYDTIRRQTAALGDQAKRIDDLERMMTEKEERVEQLMKKQLDHIAKVTHLVEQVAIVCSFLF